jgi:pyruvate/2-oxoglutarate dehydrogenase complex dihydrolipoamide acyltransferase (E2) component
MPGAIGAGVPYGAVCVLGQARERRATSRPCATLTLAFDPARSNGADGAALLARLWALLESPEVLVP